MNQRALHVSIFDLPAGLVDLGFRIEDLSGVEVIPFYKDHIVRSRVNSYYCTRALYLSNDRPYHIEWGLEDPENPGEMDPTQVLAEAFIDPVQVSFQDTQGTVAALIDVAQNPQKCRVFGILRNPNRTPAVNVVVDFFIDAPGPVELDGALLTMKPLRATSDSQGVIDILVDRNDYIQPTSTRWRVVCAVLNIDQRVTLAAPSFAIESLVMN